MIAAVLLATSVLMIGNTWNGFWFGRWGVLIAGLSIALLWRWRLKERAVWIMTASVLISGVRAFAWPDAFPGFGIDLAEEAQHYAAVAVLCYLLILTCVEKATQKQLEDALKAVGWFVLANAILTIYERLTFPANPLGKQPWGGILGNPSMSGCLMAVMVPFVPLSWLGQAIVGLGVAAAGTLAGLSVAIVVALVYQFSRRRIEWVQASVAVGMGLAVLGTGLIWKLTHGSGRYEIWRIAIRWWDAQGFYWFGSGPGTMGAFLPAAQKIASSNPEIFPWLHNDWLQLLIEQGILGLAAGVFLFITALWRARTNPRVFASLAGFGVMALVNYPVHAAPHAITLAVLLALALMEPAQGDGQSGPAPKRTARFGRSL